MKGYLYSFTKKNYYAQLIATQRSRPPISENEKFIPVNESAWINLNYLWEILDSGQDWSVY